jgi:hypothetical protein
VLAPICTSASGFPARVTTPSMDRPRDSCTSTEDGASASIVLRAGTKPSFRTNSVIGPASRPLMV